MSRSQSRSNAIVAALKSMVGGKLTLNGAVRRGRNIRQNRSQGCAVQSEVCESRVVLSAYVPDHVLLGLDSAIATPEQLETGIRSVIGGSQMKPLGDYGTFLLTLPTGLDALDAIDRLRNYPGIKYLEPDWTMQLDATPNDPNYSRMWAMENTGQLVNGVSGIPDADIDANLAWDTATGSRSVVVAVIDSGIDYLHPDLAANIWVNPGEIRGNGVDDDNNGYIDDINGYDFINGDADPSDGLGHGTHVAGTIGAVGNNGIGTVGVNWNVSMMALKVFTDSGSATTAAIIEAVNYAVDMGSVVSNNSYGGGPRSLAFENAIINAQSMNHIFVASAGNSAGNNDTNPRYPSSYPQDNIIAVAATTQSDQLAGFSHFGVVNVDIGAPGVNIWSTTPTGGSLLYGANYDFSDGTSMAAPAVAGSVALLRSLAPTVPYTVITQALYVGSDKIASMNGLVSSGGRLNVNNALSQLSVATISVSPGSVREDAGAGQATLTITKRAFPANQQLDLNLFFDDPTEVDVPSLAGGSAISIPAGQLQITIPVDILDDTLLDGTQIVTFDLHYAGASVGLGTLQVTDVESLIIRVDPASIRENAGANAGTVTVTRENTDTLPPNTFAVVNNELREYDTLGILVSTQSIPWPNSPVRPVGEDAHDLVMLQNGRVAVYNGTSTGYLSIFSPVNAAWQHFFINGLSTDAGDVATGGITSSGNYVFVSDMESSPGNPFGVVRLDLTTGTTTRFATKSPGYRLFVKDIFDSNILEVNPATGATMNTIPMPVANNFGFNNGLAFDGTNLWVLAGPIGNDQVFQLNPDTGAILDIHRLGGSTEWDGLAWVNGLLYAQDSFIQDQITVYDPAQRRVINTLNVGTLNNIDISGGLSGITGPNALIATDTFTDEIYEINPLNGIVTRTWRSGLNSEYGVGTANGEIYIGAFQNGNLSVFNRSGILQRTVDVSLTQPEGVFAIGGDDVRGITTTPFRYRDLYVGLNDKLYVLEVAGTTVARYNTTTLASEAFLDVSKPINAIAAAADGTLWGAGKDGTLYHFSSTGAELGSLVTGVAELIDIDLNITGQILLTGRDGTVVSTSTSMAAPTSFSTGFLPAFISLGRYQKLPAGDVVVTLTNSDPTEVSIPLQVVIRAGQQSVTVPLGAVDDNILDGTQTVTITASALGYIDVPSDSIDVTDAETVGVDIIANQISEAAGVGATQVRVFRTNIDGPFPYTSKHVVSNTIAQTILDYDKTTSLITVPAQTSRISDVNVTLNLKHGWLADLDIFLISPAGTRVELVTDPDPSGNGSFMTNTTFDDQAPGSILSGSAPFTGKFRPEGFLLNMNGENPSGVWTLEITDDNQSDFGTLFSWSLDIETKGLAPQLVTLSLTGDPGEISVQQTVTIPANQSEIVIPVNAIDDMLLDGTQIAGIQAGGDAPGYELGNDSVAVLDEETLTFTIDKSSVSEAAGPGALTGTLTRFNSDISSDFTMSVSSNDTSELTVPTTVTILANQTSATFSINAIDDAIVDGDQTVLITVSAPAYGSDMMRTVIVEDLEPSLKLTTGTQVVAENAGSFTVTVTRQDLADLSAAMIVDLTGGPGLTVPATATIPAGLDKVTFSVGVIDNAILDGTRNSNIQATGSLVTAGDLGITITDYETLTITVNKLSFLENAGVNAAIGTVRRSNTGNLGQALVVSLASSDQTELKVPSAVTILAGQETATFSIDAVNDPDLDGTQNVTITATAAGYVNGTVGVAVQDHEPPLLSGPTATTPSSKPKITWNALSGALRYDVWISNLTTNVAQIVRNIDVPTNSFVPPENLGIGRYRVWVRAIDQLEVPGYWSVGRDFFVNTPATITSPTPNTVIASSSFPTITWSAIPDAVKYELWVNNLTTGQNQVINRAGATALTTTSYVATENLPSGTYRIWVRGLNSSGEAGLWSLPTTHTVLAQPKITQPAFSGTFDATPTFAWTAVTGATSYDLYVADAKTKVVVLRDQFVKTTTLTGTKDIPSGGYLVWVRAQSGNSYSAWSTPSAFSIGLPPKITSATTVGTPAKPKFTWTTIAGTEHYELWVNNAASVRVIYETNLKTTTFTSATTLAAGTYRVWVRAVSTMGVTTDWSTPVDLVVASSELPKGTLGSAQTMILASLILVDLPLTPDSSSVERSDAFSSGAETPVNADVMPDVAVPIASVTNSINPIEPALTMDSEFDAVMSEWQSADWWTETPGTQDRKELHSTAALAASLGLVVRHGQRADDRRKRKS